MGQTEWSAKFSEGREVVTRDYCGEPFPTKWKYKGKCRGNTWIKFLEENHSVIRVRDSTWLHPTPVLDRPATVISTECVSNPDNQIPSYAQPSGVSEAHKEVSTADTPPKVVTTLNSAPIPKFHPLLPGFHKEILLGCDNHLCGIGMVVCEDVILRR